MAVGRQAHKPHAMYGSSLQQAAFQRQESVGARPWTPGLTLSSGGPGQGF